jgi:hypothetical protein
LKTLLRYCFILISIQTYTNVSAKAVVLSNTGSDATLKSIVLSTATSLFYTTGPSDYNYTTSVSPGTPTLTVEPTTNDPSATVTVNGVVVPYGSQSSAITLNGIVTTTIKMVVTASDNVTTHSYSIVVYETGSNNAYLNALSVSTGGTLASSSTGPGTFNYTTSVAVGTSSLTVTPTTADANATVFVNGTQVTSGTASGSVPLNSALNATTTITVKVIAQDGVTTQTYAIIVTESGSNIATLSTLSVSTGTNLVLSPGSTNYTTAVNNSVTSLTVTPTATDANATITVNGAAVTNGGTSAAITLNTSGATTINLVVTAQDGTTTKAYSITVSKGASSNAALASMVLSTGNAIISSGSNSYTTSVSKGTPSLTITPTAADPNATITVNGVIISSGTASGAIALNAYPATTAINIQVKSADATTTISTTIVVSQNGSNNANSGSIVLNPNSTLVNSSTGSSNVNWTTSVNSNISSIIVTATPADTTATVTVNGVAVTSSSKYASASLPLNSTGTTLITVVFTAQDGVTTKSYGITVSKGGSNNATVSSIVLSTAVLNPACTLMLSSTSSGVVNYNASVSTGTTSLTVTTSTVDPLAKISVNNGTQSNGNSSVAVTLNTTGTTLISIVIISEDGTTTKTYNVTVSQNGSNNANITSLTLSTGTSRTGITGSSNLNYATSVSPHTTSMTVTTVLQDPTATLTVNGFAVANGAPSNPVQLNAYPATTLINIVVTAQDGHTKLTVSYTVSKTGASIAWTGAAGNYSIAVASATKPAISLSIAITGTIPNGSIPSGTILELNSGSGQTAIVTTSAISSASTTVSVKALTQDIANGVYTPSWNTAANWNPAQVPGASDVASFGVSAYTGNPPVILSSLTIGEIDFGANTPTTLTIKSGYKLTIGTVLAIFSGATATISSSTASSASVDISPGAMVADTGVLTINPHLVFTLKSNSAGSASVGQIAVGSIVGNVSVERYITGGSSTYRGYRLLSSPVYQSAANGNKIYSLNYVQASSLVTGAGGTANGFDSSPLNNPSLLLYREDQVPPNTFTSGNYSGISNFNISPAIAVTNNSYSNFNYYFNYYVSGGSTVYNIPIGNGFDFYFRGDRTNLSNKFISSTSAESVTMVTTGTLNAGPITVHDWFTPTLANLSYTTNIANSSVRGFNLVGNPYASSIDWDTYNTTTPGTGIYAPNVGNSVYELDPVSKQYGVYMANSGVPGTNNATHIIASGQGFLVQAQSTGASLTFNESAKTTVQVTGPGLLLGKPVANAVTQYLHLKLNQKLGPDSVQADEIYIRFNNSANSKFLVNEDAAQKPGFGIASLASMSSDGVPLSINSLKLPQQSATIALNVNAVTDGTYQLSMPDVKSIPALFDIWLIDAYKKDSIDIRNNPVYSFNINNSDSTSYGSKRFSLVMRQNPALALRLLNFTATKVTNGAQIVWKTVNEENYTNFTVQRSTDDGKTFDVLDGLLSNNQGTYSYLDKAPSMAPNQYRLKLEDFNGNISYSQVITLSYSNLSNSLTIKTISVYPNPASTVINLAIARNSSSTSNSSVLQTADLIQTNNSGPLYDIKIISISGTVVKTVTSSQPNWQGNVSNLLPGTYIITVQNSNDKSLVGKNMFVKL